MLSKQRQGEIALLFLKNKMRKEGISLGQNTRREIGNVAKEIGINTEEAAEFAEIVTREIVDEIFPPQKHKIEVVEL